MLSFIFLSVVAKESPSNVWDKMNRRLHHITKLRTNSSRFESEHTIVSICCYIYYKAIHCTYI